MKNSRIKIVLATYFAILSLSCSSKNDITSINAPLVNTADFHLDIENYQSEIYLYQPKEKRVSIGLLFLKENVLKPENPNSSNTDINTYRKITKYNQKNSKESLTASITIEKFNGRQWVQEIKIKETRASLQYTNHHYYYCNLSNILLQEGNYRITVKNLKINNDFSKTRIKIRAIHIPERKY